MKIKNIKNIKNKLNKKMFLNLLLLLWGNKKLSYKNIIWKNQKNDMDFNENKRGILNKNSK